ncbi:MAG: 30S ribosomal protein S16 [Chloroflexi bacterium]|nr:30S ribosomal protein S16 [Chloroflexota bacterium]
MVKIRLRRVGATKKPQYRIVAADSRSPRDGRFIEILGHYNPLTEPATVVVKGERVEHWLRHGAQPTDVVARLLRTVGTASASGAVAVAQPASTEAEQTPAVEDAPTDEATEVSGGEKDAQD